MGGGGCDGGEGGGSAGSVEIGLIILDFKTLSTTRCHLSISIIENVFHDKMVKTKIVMVTWKCEQYKRPNSLPSLP